jgi:ribosomal protein S18 acetylase RimI-like enzyme
MRIDVIDLVPTEQKEAVWRLYNEAFEELRTTAVQRHVMIREEFDFVMRDRRVAKYVARYVGAAAGAGAAGRARMCALATLTNELDAMPLVSPDYFRSRWPSHFEEGRIFYIGFVAVHPDFRGTGVFERVVTELYRTVSQGRGVAVLDVCRRNEQLYHLPQAIHRLLDALSGMVLSDRIDEQSYWCYEFPSLL